MKTITEFAKEIGVTPQAVYKKINQFNNELKTGLQKNKKGKMLLTPKGQSFLRDKFQPSCKPVDNEFNNQFTNRLEQENKELQEELRLEREHNRALNSRVLDLADQMAELTRNNQVLLKQEQDRNIIQLPELAEPERKGIAGKIKSMFTKK